MRAVRGRGVNGATSGRSRESESERCTSSARVIYLGPSAPLASPRPPVASLLEDAAADQLRAAANDKCGRPLATSGRRTDVAKLAAPAQRGPNLAPNQRRDFALTQSERRFVLSYLLAATARNHLIGAVPIARFQTHKSCSPLARPLAAAAACKQSGVTRAQGAGRSQPRR